MALLTVMLLIGSRDVMDSGLLGPPLILMLGMLTLVQAASRPISL